VTLEDQRAAEQDQRAADLAERVALAKQEARARREDPREAARRTEVNLWVALVTLSWLVSVSMLLGWVLSSPGPLPRGGGTATGLASVLIVLLPFVAAVIATKSRRFWLGGGYVVLTLVMVLPAIAIARG
jgi:hypothetical protein